MKLDSTISLGHILLASVGWAAALIGTYIKSVRRSDHLEYRIETLEGSSTSLGVDIKEIKSLLLDIQLKLKDKADRPTLS